MFFRIALLCSAVLLSMMHCTNYDNDRYKKANIQLVNKGIEQLGQIYSLTILDTYSIFFDSRGQLIQSLFHGDGLHLSKAGYENWVNKALLPYVENHTFKTIALVGNSITQGVDSYDFGNKDPSESNWQLLLKIKASNLGVGGNTSFDIIRRLKDIASCNADCYILLIGINDINNEIQIWETLNNIEYIVKYFQSINREIVLQYVMPFINL